jgi:hypothetical protein
VKKRILFIILLIIIPLILGGCSAKDPLIGTWEEPASGITLGFKDDGTLVIARHGASYSVEYEKQEPNIIAITAAAINDFPVRSFTYQLEEDKLIITVDNVQTTFFRVDK